MRGAARHRARRAHLLPHPLPQPPNALFPLLVLLPTSPALPPILVAVIISGIVRHHGHRLNHRDPPPLLPLVPPSFLPFVNLLANDHAPFPLLLCFFLSIAERHRCPLSFHFGHQDRTPSSPPLFSLHLVTVPAISFSSPPSTTTSTIVAASLPSSCLRLHRLHRDTTSLSSLLFLRFRHRPSIIASPPPFPPHRRAPDDLCPFPLLPLCAFLLPIAEHHRLDADLRPIFPTVFSSPALPTTVRLPPLHLSPSISASISSAEHHWPPPSPSSPLYPHLNHHDCHHPCFPSSFPWCRRHLSAPSITDFFPRRHRCRCSQPPLSLFSSPASA